MYNVILFTKNFILKYKYNIMLTIKIMFIHLKYSQNNYIIYQIKIYKFTDIERY